MCLKRDDTDALGLIIHTVVMLTGQRRSQTNVAPQVTVSVLVRKALISWKSRKQPTVALSTCKAAIQECMYLQQLLKGIDAYQYAQTKVFDDNQGAIALARNPVNRQRCKHIDIKYHFIRETVKSGRICLEYCSTDNMVADIMTKPATKLKLQKFAQYLFGT